jgi:hypothetical protein
MARAAMRNVMEVATAQRRDPSSKKKMAARRTHLAFVMVRIWPTRRIKPTCVRK